MPTRPKTIILDIDGCLLEHPGAQSTHATKTVKVLPGVLEKLDQWELEGARFIILTGRKESMREQTVHELCSAGIHFDQMVMGVGGGDRYLINDCKSDGRETAFAVNIERDKGLSDVNL
jgi:hypothetical protein